MSPVDGVAAAQTLLSWGTCDPGYCLRYVWNAYAAHGATSDQSYATAHDAWKGSAGKHEGDWNPPAGVPVYLGPRDDSAAGDVVISLGEGMCAATDWPGWGTIGTCSLGDRVRQTGRPYLGWTETILNYPIAQASGGTIPGDITGDPMALRIITSPSYRAAGQMVIHNGLTCQTIGNAEGLDYRGNGVTGYDYEFDYQLTNEVARVWQFNGLTAEAAAQAAADMLKSATEG